MHAATQQHRPLWMVERELSRARRRFELAEEQLRNAEKEVARLRAEAERARLREHYI
jgi:hypothetical protein